MNTDFNLFSFQRSIKAPADQIYRCFTSGIGFQEWLCHSAQISPRPGGCLHLLWNSGFYTVGEYTRLDPCQEIQFTWHGRTEPQSSQVQVLLSQKGQVTQVDLIHSCIGNEDIWVEARKSIQSGWERSLNNLESVLTTGIDQRIVNRPVIGIYPLELNAELSSVSNLPVTSGIYLNDIIEGRSADRAGLIKGDVIVEINGETTTDIPTLVRTLQSHKIGDRLFVDFYRGQTKSTVEMEICSLTIPDVPLEAAKLAELVRSSNSEDLQNLYKCFDGVSEKITAKKIDDDWTANEVLAHLIHTEQALHFGIQCAIVDQEFQFADNIEARVYATLVAYPTHKELLDEFHRAQIETATLVNQLPQEFSSRKSSLWRLGYRILSLKTHNQEHIIQIQRAIERARG